MIQRVDTATARNGNNIVSCRLNWDTSSARGSRLSEARLHSPKNAEAGPLRNSVFGEPLNFRASDSRSVPSKASRARARDSVPQNANSHLCRQQIEDEDGGSLVCTATNLGSAGIELQVVWRDRPWQPWICHPRALGP